MARVTVEDCVDKIPNRFDLVLLSAQRARQISGGAELTIDRDRDKNPVVALREIAEQMVKPRELQEALVSSLQRVQVDEDDVADGDADVAVEFRLAAGEGDEGRVGDRDEVAAVRVEEVGRAGAEPGVRELHVALDVVALGLDAQAVATESHG